MKLVAMGVILATGVFLIWGCAERENLALPNLPPETYIAIADSVRNPTTYIQTIRWWGEDVDGEVVGYEYRWSTDPIETGCPMDTGWVFTEETAKDFDLPVTEGMSTHHIRVRAIDDDGVADPTPSSLTLPVTNSPPQVMIWHQGALPDTTFPAILIKWHGDDPEGDETIESYKVWLDGEEDNALVLSPEDTVASFGYEDFEGRYGERTLYVVAIDSGCDTSNTATHTWHVKEPRGDVLLVDDLSAEESPGHAVTDLFYRDALNSRTDSYSVLDFEAFGGRAPSYSYNFLELFKLFDFIIWYNEPVRFDTAYCSPAEQAVLTHLETGGRFLLVSLGAIGSNGALTDSVAFEVFGIDSLYKRSTKKGTTTNFDCMRWRIEGNSSLGLDSLKVSGLFTGVECMEPRGEAIPLYYIPPGTASAQQTSDYYLGILNSWGAGKAAILTFPISRSDTYGNATRELCRVIELMLE